jgi:hypothetical protein
VVRRWTKQTWGHPPQRLLGQFVSNAKQTVTVGTSVLRLMRRLTKVDNENRCMENDECGKKLGKEYCYSFSSKATL